MSYTIYNKTFSVKLSDGRIIPFINVSESNVYDPDTKQRAKDWDTLSMEVNNGCPIFTLDELKHGIEEWSESKYLDQDKINGVGSITPQRLKNFFLVKCIRASISLTDVPNLCKSIVFYDGPANDRRRNEIVFQPYNIEEQLDKFFETHTDVLAYITLDEKFADALHLVLELTRKQLEKKKKGNTLLEVKTKDDKKVFVTIYEGKIAFTEEKKDAYLFSISKETEKSVYSAFKKLYDISGLSITHK